MMKMSRLQGFSLALILMAASALLIAQTQGQAFLLNINGAIGPATADYVQRGIQSAAQKNAEVIILRIDTPGGLDKSMRVIIKSILASPIPVVSYVAPSGARAASAGTFILYASHVAAMAPGTNLGAASPVSIGGGFPKLPNGDKKAKDKSKKASPKSTMHQKVTKDAVAYIRSLAQLRGRNIHFAEQAVKTAATLSALDAKKKNVIEIIARDLPDLMKQLNGYKVVIQGKQRILATQNITIETVVPDWRSKFLAVITDPSVAYILLMIGIYGLFFEFANPGFVLPGVAGAIALLLALYAFQLLPISYAGLGLVILGIIFMVAEAFMPSFGALGFGGIIAFIVGSILLLDTELPGYQIAKPLIVAMAFVNALFFITVMGMALKARRRAVVSGRDFLLNKEGYAIEDIKEVGQAKISGEIWQIHSDVPLKSGDPVKVVAIEGLTLKVEPLS